MLRTSPAIAPGIALRSAADMAASSAAPTIGRHQAPGAYSKGLETEDFASPVLPIGGARQSVERQAIQIAR
jgi:hypothetical protein